LHPKLSTIFLDSILLPGFSFQARKILIPHLLKNKIKRRFSGSQHAGIYKRIFYRKGKVGSALGVINQAAIHNKLPR
jgi:hypothetical protein